MDYAQSFTKLLQTSADALHWAVQQVPEDRLYTVSTKRPESWSVARHVMHLQYHEEQVVLPCMRLWLDDRYPDFRQQEEDTSRIARYQDFDTLVHDEEIAWQHPPEMETLQALFRTGREEQITLLPLFTSKSWEEERATVWGQVTLRWAITKTYQHTLEHSTDILKHALFGGNLRMQE